jgi:phosphatidylserine synthase
MFSIHDPVDQLSFLVSLMGLAPTAYFGVFVEKSYTTRQTGFWNIYGFMIVCLGVIQYRWERGAEMEDLLIFLIAFMFAAFLLVSSRSRKKTKLLKTLGSSRLVFGLSVFVILFGFFGDWRWSATVAAVAYVLSVLIKWVHS